MIQKASRIVEKALELADMADSHVISYKEEVEYLAQAWKYVNEKCIQHGVKYFYGHVPVASGLNVLPWDFSQIDSIRTRDGYQLPRHTNDMPDGFGSYDIVGNNLQIYGAIPQTLEMYYWKKPIELTFPAPKQQVDLPFTEWPEKYSLYGDYIVYVEGSDLIVFNLKRNEEVHRESMNDVDVLDIQCGKGTYYLKTSYNNTTVHSIVSYKNQYVKQEEDNAAENKYWQVIYLENDMQALGYFHLEDDDEKYLDIYKWDSSTPITIKVDTSVADPGNILYARDHLYCLSDGKVYDLTTGELLDEDSDHKFLRFYINWESAPTLVTNRKYIWKVNGDIYTEELDTEYPIVTVIKLDNDTGYGLLTTDSTDTFVESHIPDTELDFPSTLMYEFLSYYLAYLYQLKLGVDTTSMEKAYTAAEDLMVSTLDSNFSYKQVQDVTLGDGFWC